MKNRKIKKILFTVSAFYIIGITWADNHKIEKWSLEYEGNKTPNTKGFAIRGKAVSANCKNGIFHFNTIGSDKGNYYYRYVRSSDKLSLDSDVGYTLEFKLKVIGTDIKKNSSAIHFDAEDGRPDVKRYWGISFYTGKDSNYAILSGATKSTPVAVGSEFHVYRITAKEDTVNLYIDGTFVCSVKASGKTSTNQIRFGDLTGKADGEFEMDYFKIFNQGAVAPK